MTDYIVGAAIFAFGLAVGMLIGMALGAVAHASAMKDEPKGLDLTKYDKVRRN